MALAVVSLSAHSIVAEKPILGGLGLKLLETIPTTSLGAEVEWIREAAAPDNRNLSAPNPILTGQALPWRHFLNPSSPRILRKFKTRSYVMVDENLQVMRAIAIYEIRGCGPEIDWLVKTITKKYQVQGSLEATPIDQYEKAFRATFSDRQIDVRCGPDLVLDYADYRAIERWNIRQQSRANTNQREVAEMDKRKLVLARRRAISFAETFTLGDRFRLMGAFGIPFNQPFAAKSSQNFPIDQPFIAALPNLPHLFSGGEITLEIDPNRNPIVIRGKFENIEFERLATALAAKYGTALKSSTRHVIHKVAGNHAIIKQLDDRFVELAFIDTKAQKAQRKRRWELESEGV